MTDIQVYNALFRKTQHSMKDSKKTLQIGTGVPTEFYV